MRMTARVSKALRIFLGVRRNFASAPFHGPMKNLGGPEGNWSSCQSEPAIVEMW
ncbi:hypothetical protein chiPu_0030942, partial [Chiloscyllium punctatum]|nr:hypothetical protein [Chiloscyllium punctatum]